MLNNFIIIIGSQRAGSTLLHNILDECTNIFMHPLKELHYYDTLFKVRHDSILKKFSKRQLDRELHHMVNSEDHSYINKRYRCYIRANLLLLNENIATLDYVDLYRPCLADNPILGETTPEYMILPKAGVKIMSRDVGRNAKIILVARNPVKRFMSSVKLLNAYNRDDYSPDDFEKKMLQLFETMPGWIKAQTKFNDYESALAVYRKFFSDVCFISYDELVTNPGKTHGKLEDFLSLKINREKYEAMLKNKINAMGITGVISDHTRGKLEKLFKFSKKYLDKTFGKDQVVL